MQPAARKPRDVYLHDVCATGILLMPHNMQSGVMHFHRRENYWSRTAVSGCISVEAGTSACITSMRYMQTTYHMCESEHVQLSKTSATGKLIVSAQAWCRVTNFGLGHRCASQLPMPANSGAQGVVSDRMLRCCICGRRPCQPAICHAQRPYCRFAVVHVRTFRMPSG